nr:geobacillin-26 family protein [Bacillus cereus]
MNLQQANSLLKNRKKRDNWEIQVLDHASSLDGRFEYTYYNQNVWLIRVPGENAKNPVENNDNKTDLNNFRTSVNNLMTNEVAFLSKIGGEVGLGCLSLLSTPTPWTTVAGAATAIGLAVWAVPDLYKVFQEADNCRYHFNRI